MFDHIVHWSWWYPYNLSPCAGVGGCECDCIMDNGVQTTQLIQRCWAGQVPGYPAELPSALSWADGTTTEQQSCFHTLHLPYLITGGTHRIFLYFSNKCSRWGRSKEDNRKWKDESHDIGWKRGFVRVLSYICLRSRPISPNVGRQSVS